MPLLKRFRMKSTARRTFCKETPYWRRIAARRGARRDSGTRELLVPIGDLDHGLEALLLAAESAGLPNGQARTVEGELRVERRQDRVGGQVDWSRFP
jgi:hypothetical protein